MATKKKSPTDRTAHADGDLRRAAAILVVVVLTVIAFFAYRPGAMPPTPPETVVEDGVWFDKLVGVERLSREQELEVAGKIFEALYNPGSGDLARFTFSDDQPRMLLLSLSDGVAKARVLHQTGESLRVSAEGLLSQVDELAEQGLTPVWAKLDFVTSVVENPALVLADPFTYERSLFGLAFEETSGIALLPEVLVAETIIDSSTQFRADALSGYLEQTGLPTSYANGLASLQSIPAFHFTTSSYFYENGGLLTLYRGHRVFPVYTNIDLENSLRGGGRYLTAAVGEDGRFLYSYLPKTDSVSADYNILRHAGTTYAMLDLYTHTEKEELLAAASRAIRFMMAQVRLCPVGSGFESCLIEEERAKLGGNGLAVLALTYYMRATGDQALLEDAQSLARWMVSLQAESGEFTTHIMEYATGRDTGSVSEYYPGEAIYALANLYLLDGNEEWLRAAQDGARWLANDRIAGKAPGDVTHDHWLLLGLDVIQHISPDPVYYEASLTIADAIIRTQNSDPEFPDWYGSFYKPPRSTPAATRTEGLMAAYRVARDYGTPEEADRIVQAAKNSISFQLGTQFYPEKAMYLPNPQRVLGGFHRDLTNFEIRNDYVQHNISGILALLRALTH
jgi:hypothetical protein